jgi:hypothetical protein
MEERSLILTVLKEDLVATPQCLSIEMLREALSK